MFDFYAEMPEATQEYLKGYFALQVHKSKEALIDFRNLKVKEL